MPEIYNEFHLHFYMHVTFYHFSRSDDHFYLSRESLLSNLVPHEYNESLVLRLEELIERSLYFGV